ncbi:G2/M phase-specific E3 ubiquitin-protein ligase-like [Gadus chalcogrammus]|uniref:G2/M phase-specific E3 ubiquitin-protein ligase-like n=1 Tax=Gadus chalcogrammus TaxID=1042646 RepID=UPI0024C4D041|nr:G2/M phase-specific E3 ubiquitin-protein ligase-like [Gadus chalcogrammus]
MDLALLKKMLGRAGTSEEAEDLGGPRREFLRLLTEALAQSSVFEGTEGNLNLALDSSAVREDRYFVTGRAIAVSLVHGGPSPNFLSQTLFDCIVQGPAKSRPNLGDIADSEIREKIQKVCCIFISSYSAVSIYLSYHLCPQFKSTTLEELTQSTEPLQDYLANAGCLKPLKSVDDRDRLVEDVLMFQVINRVRGPFERYFKFICVLCLILCCPACSTEEDGSKKLGDIRAFATGSDAVPPIGFSPQPSLEFLHPSGGAAKFPVANTCISCLRLPIYSTYDCFKTNMDFAIRNTQGFGMP